MPFDPDNPPAKLKNLSDKKKRQWIHVFNSCYEKTPDEKKCHMQAWGVVKKSASDEDDILSDKRIVMEITNAIRDIKAALRCQTGKAKRPVRIIRESSRRQPRSVAAESQDRR